MTYPKVMTAGPHQSVVVANEEQERALPKAYGGLAEGKEASAPVAEAAPGSPEPAAPAKRKSRKKKA